MSTPYTNVDAIQAIVPPPVLDDALDDNGDGLRDIGLIDQIIANASDAVDAMICNRVSLPLDTPPASVRNAALWFAVEQIYERREKQIPASFATSIKAVRDLLASVRDGSQQLNTTSVLASPAGSGAAGAVPSRLTTS